MSLTKTESRNRIKHRVRKKVRGSADRPRLSVFRSNKGIECQLIDDDKQMTLASASTHEKSWENNGNKTEQAKAIGKLIGERALALNVETIVFDRSGYLYHGRVKALAEGAREAGLKF